METESQATIQGRPWLLGKVISTTKSSFVAAGQLAKRQPLGFAAGILVLLMIVVALLAKPIAPYDPTATSPRESLQGPSGDHLLGTDQFGRDVFSRVVEGTRVSLTVGVLATVIGVVSGTVIGALSGYVRGFLDLAVQRITDAVMALPALLVVLILTMIIGSGQLNIVWALALSIAPATNRVVRSAVLAEVGAAHVQAARIMGASPARLLWRHILPHTTSPVIVVASLTIANVILLEAAVSFLGFGIAAPTPSWGNMLSISGTAYMKEAPWLALAPGGAIIMAVLAFNLFGDTLRDILDPRFRSL